MLIHAVFLVLLGIVSWQDIKEKRIGIVWLIIAGMLAVVSLVQKSVSLSGNHILAIVPGLVCMCIALYRQSMGIADALMLIISGLILGAEENMLLCLLAFCIAGLAALGLVLIRKKSRDYEIPFFPCMLAGYVLEVIIYA